MKFKAFPKLLFFLLAISALSPSCKKELDREQFLATYSVIENCVGSTPDNFDITISASSKDDNSVLISNFGNFVQLGVNFSAEATGFGYKYYHSEPN
jgi:hypothetical protein